MPPIRILQVTSVLNYGGIETMIMNVFRNVNRDNIVFDFLVIREDKGVFENEILKLGGRIYKIPSMKKVGYFKFIDNLLDFFKSHTEYGIIHSHVNTFNGPILKCAKKCGVKTRISHSHTAYPKYPLIEKAIKGYFKSMIKNSATHFFSCSEIASQWLYGKNFKNNKVIINGIKTHDFLFSNAKREELRKKLNIEDKLVLLNISRFYREKNHFFLLKILKEIVKTNKNAMLVCIGNGVLRNSFINQALKMELSENVIVLDSTRNVQDYYNMADVYVSPSLFEGFGVSVAEAQFNSLPCIISNSFPKEINVFDNCKFISLKEHPTIWAEAILSSKRNNLFMNNQLNLSVYDVSYTADYLTDFYLNSL